MRGFILFGAGLVLAAGGAAFVVAADGADGERSAAAMLTRLPERLGC